MTTFRSLHDYLRNISSLYPQQIAVEEAGDAKITYDRLSRLSDLLRDRLRMMGVKRGDRVGIYLPKCIDAVVSIFGILKAGAAYVPVDPKAPVSRNAYILSDCTVRALIIDQQFITTLNEQPEFSGFSPKLLKLKNTGGGKALEEFLNESQKLEPAPMTESAVVAPEDLAYILYTSGSTGKPKGVMLSHFNAVSFVDWCSRLLHPSKTDRFSSHAPFHFDLSILDIYVPIKHGATLILIGEELGKDPVQLSAYISKKRITSWYSTPSILILLLQYGKMDRFSYNDLHTILFAGEVFPIKYLRMLKKKLPRPRYLNLYGPTETNVCTYYQIPENIPEDRTDPYPIGKTCEHLKSIVVDIDGNILPPGEEGELCISGGNVMGSYWNLPEQNKQVFLVQPDGTSWYRTGDLVNTDADGNYIYLGRRDRMVKKRGYRVELGEIEVCLYQHPDISEAAVIAIQDPQEGIRVKAFLSANDEKRPSLIQLKRFCAQNLPAYMVPDMFTFLDKLPKTSTDKTDYQALKKMS